MVGRIGSAVVIVGLVISACHGGGASPGTSTSTGKPVSTATPKPSAPFAQAVPIPASLEIEDLRRQFDYDRSTPLNYREEQPEDAGNGIRTIDISYDSPRGGRTEALLAVPAGSGPFAGMVFMGGLGATKLAMRGDAIDYATLGAVGISISQSQTRSGHPPLFTYDAIDREEIVATVLDLRRAIDVLLARADVDASRIGFEGFSHGAATGGTLSGVDHRISAFLLKSGGTLAFLKRDYPNSKSKKAEYLALMATVDQVRYVHFAAPSALYLQDGTQDSFFGRDDMNLWHSEASQPKKTQFYESGHGLEGQALLDGMNWLIERLQLRRP